MAQYISVKGSGRVKDLFIYKKYITSQHVSSNLIKNIKVDELTETKNRFKKHYSFYVYELLTVLLCILLLYFLCIMYFVYS